MSNAIDLVVSKKAIEGLNQLEAKLLAAHNSIVKINALGVKFNGGKPVKGLPETISLQAEYNKLVKQTESANNKATLAQAGYNKAILEARNTTNELNKQTRLQIKSTSALSDAYTKVDAKLSLLIKDYRNLAIRKEQGDKLTKREIKRMDKLRGKIQKLDSALKRVDASTGRFGRSVANYPKQINPAISSIRALASAMGLVGGAFLFVQVMRDAFNRVREFDKAMQNISGILRTNRSELKDLEQVIIEVAGASIKTSREVAGLAESLVTLGKSKGEIKQLLKPVNDLAIGLETTGEEAAEFLVQTLNAFGAGSDEAEKYADTIATIRTSTTLNFQKMRDSFQFLTPISRILNKDLAFTGALIGVLADNGVRAERAGRLLGTAQQKLAKEGKTLFSALNEINEAFARGVKEEELLALASDLFGKQAAALGIILANNTSIIEKNAQAIRDNGGALDDLVSEQLESLDAKLKILDSTWEKFILSIEKGDGVISRVVKTFIELATEAFNLAILFNKLSTTTYNEHFIEKFYQQTLRLLDAEKQTNEVLEASLGINQRKLAQLKTAAKFDNLTEKQLKDNKLEQLQQIGIIKALKEKIVTLKELEQLEGDGASGGGDGDVSRQKNLKTVLELEKKIGKEKTFNIAQTVSMTDAIKEQITATENILSRLPKWSEGYTLVKNKLDQLKDSLEGIKVDKIIKDLDKWAEKYEEQQKLIRDTHKFYADQRRDIERDLQNTIKDLAISVVDSIFEVQLRRFDRESQLAQDTAERDLLFAGDSAAAQENIQNQLADREEDIQRRREETERKAFLFQQAFRAGEVAIDTIQAVAELKAQAAILLANPVTAPLAGLALGQIPLVIATGAIAGGAILAQSLPAFKDGVHDFAGGLAIVGDGGVNEVVETPNGTFLTPNKDTLVNLPNKSNVYSNQEEYFREKLNQVLSNNGIQGIRDITIPKGLTKQDLDDVMSKQFKKMPKGQAVVNFDKKGIHTYWDDGVTKKKMLNARVRGLGRNV